MPAASAVLRATSASWAVAAAPSRRAQMEEEAAAAEEEEEAAPRMEEEEAKTAGFRPRRTEEDAESLAERNLGV